MNMNDKTLEQLRQEAIEAARAYHNAIVAAFRERQKQQQSA
jgi:hypothetical protein